MTGTELAASIGPGLAKAAVAMEVDGALWDLSRELPDGASVRFVRFQDDEALPLIRHDAAHLMAEAVKELWPDDPGHDRPGDRGRLLLRLRPRRAVHARRPRGDRGAHARDRAARRAARARGVGARQGGRVLRGAGRALQGRADRGDPRRRADHHLPAGRLHRPLPRPAHAEHRPDGRVQAPEGRRRLLARRQPQPDAAADLRHRLGEPEAARCLSAPARGGGAARSPAARPPARLVPLPGGGGGLGLLAPQGLDDLPHDRELSAPPAGAGRLRGGPHAAADRPGACGRPRATGKSSASTCSRSSPSTRRWRSSR